MPVKSILDEPENLEILKESYLIKKMSTTQISKESENLFGVKISGAPIFTALKRNGIPVRSKSESVSLATSLLDQNISFMNEEVLEAIDGFLLGDGGIGRPSSEHCKTARLNMGSTEKEWTDYAMSFFKAYSPSDATQSGKARDRSPNLTWTSNSKHHVDIYHQYKRWYPNGGLKQIPKDVRITPISLLLWYLGDGSITKSGVSYVVRFATCSFNPKDIDEILLPKMEKMGLYGKRTKYKNDIKLNTSSVKRFFEIIGSKSPISCYNYKFEFNQWLNYYRLSQVVKNDKEAWRVRYMASQGKLDCTRSPGSKLIIFDELQAKKIRAILDNHNPHDNYPDVDDKDKKIIFNLRDIVSNDIERWNALYFTSNKLVESITKTTFDESQRDKLRDKLDFYGEKSAVPEKDINRFFRKYRTSGFPHYKVSDEKISAAIKNLKETNGTLSWDGYGTEVATYFHPHIFNCKKPNKLSAIEFFNDDDLFKKGIKKLIALYGSNKITDSKIREICRNDNASSRINNFPPRVLIKCLMRYYKNGERDLTMLDPCSGFSGRLIGAHCSGMVGKYIGIDISEKTYKGGLRAKEKLDDSMKVELVHGDCLKEMKNFRNIDIIYTSPPFLDVEIYDGVDYMKDYEEWIENFVKPFIKECFDSLKDGGVCMLYLEDIRRHKFKEDFINLAMEHFSLLPKIYFEMSYGENNRNKKNKRGVPVIVLEK